MKDLVDRFLKQQSGNKPTIVDDGLDSNQPESTLAMDAPHSRPLLRTTKSSLRRIYQNGSKARIALQWTGVSGQARLLKYALELAQTEYREGFVFSGYLGSAYGHEVKESTVSWAPVTLNVLLTRRCNRKRSDLPYGVGVSGRGELQEYSYRDLDGTIHKGTDPYALHTAFIKERRKILVDWMEGDVGPKTRQLLAARVSRIDALLLSGLEVDYL